MIKGKLVLLIGLVVLLLGMVGIYSINQSESVTTEPTQKVGAKAPDDKGAIREINGLEIAFNKARAEESLSEDESHYVIVDLTFSNNRENVYEFSPYKITIVDEDGYAYNPTTKIETKGILGGQLHPGRQNRGEIAFSVPIGEYYELVYTDHLRTGQVTWEVIVEE